MAEGNGDIIGVLERARHDPARAVLEGIHALKHAVRFGARLDPVLTPDLRRWSALLAELAPDVLALLTGDGRPGAQEVDAATWTRLAPRGLPSPSLAVAPRPPVDPAAVLVDPSPRPVVLLEAPTHLGNLGAVVRVAAAADAAGVLTTGTSDPWHPTALRAAAGLQFALPVARIDHLPASERPVVALDPEGDDLRPGSLPPRAVLAFGTERGGLSDQLLAQADLRVRLPMRAGVASLNLATAVAATLYGGR